MIFSERFEKKIILLTDIDDSNMKRQIERSWRFFDKFENVRWTCKKDYEKKIMKKRPRKKNREKKIAKKKFEKYEIRKTHWNICIIKFWTESNRFDQIDIRFVFFSKKKI